MVRHEAGGAVHEVVAGEQHRYPQRMTRRRRLGNGSEHVAVLDAGVVGPRADGTGGGGELVDKLEPASSGRDAGGPAASRPGSRSSLIAGAELAANALIDGAASTATPSTAAGAAAAASSCARPRG